MSKLNDTIYLSREEEKKIETEMVNMNIKNTFKKIVAILGIIGVSVVSFAEPPKHPKPKPKAMVVQPKRKTINKKPAKRQSMNPQGRRNTRRPDMKKSKRR